MKLPKLSKNDQVIIEQITAGGMDETKAITKLINQNKSKVMALIKKYNGSTEEAEDTLIEGITEVIFHIKKGRFKGDSRIDTYLYRICRLIWFQKFRSKKVDHFSQDIDDSITLSLQAELEYSDKKEVLDSVLDLLGEACKQVLSLWSKGFNMTEIKNKLGYANSQISMNKKSKCLTKLRDLIKKNPSLHKLMEELR